jgi:UrcA family protein
LAPISAAIRFTFRREGEEEMVTRFHARMAVVAVTLIFAGSGALAQDGQIIVRGPGPDTRFERVGYYDLNLAARTDERTLYRRVGNAVERVCLYDEGRWYGLAVPDYNQCAERSWRGARPQVIGAVYRARLRAYGNGY